jgi:hypothetical protein
LFDDSWEFLFCHGFALGFCFDDPFSNFLSAFSSYAFRTTITTTAAAGAAASEKQGFFDSRSALDPTGVLIR